MGRNAASRIVAVVMAAAWVLGGTAALAAETVATRAAAHGGFGRIVFDWAAPATYEAKIDDRVLTVTFARPLSASFAGVRSSLRDYVSDVRTSADGRTVAFSLTGDFSLRTFVSEKSVVVDLLGDAAARHAPAPNPTPAPPRVDVRVGDHSGYSRIVFDWRLPVDYKVTHEDGRATIRFDRRATIDLAALNATPLRRIRAGESEIAGGRTMVALAVASPARLRHFRSGTSVVLDVLAAPRRSAAGNRPEAAAAPPTGAPTPRDNRSAPPPEVTVEAAPPPPAPPPRPGAEGAPQTIVGIPLGATAAQIPMRPPPMKIAVESTVARSLVSLNGGKRLASAAFVRGGDLWLVFPERYSVDLTDALANESPAYESVAQVPHSSATILRFRLRAGYGVTFSRRDTLWLAQFTAKPEPPEAIELRPFDDETRGSGVQLMIADVAGSVQVSDPDDGTAFVVVPVATSATGVVGGQGFEGFDLLETVQGIVARPTARGFDVRTSLAGVEFAHVAGAAERPAARQPARITRRTRPATRLLDFVTWRSGDDSEFFANSQALQYAVATAPAAKRRRARIDQLLFLFANGYFAEVLGRFELLMEEDPTVAEDPLLRAMRGIAQLLLDRDEGASADLDDPSLDAYDDVALWRGVLASRQADNEAATTQFVRAGDLWLELPQPLRSRVGLIAAEAALETINMSAANAYLDAILDSAEDPGVIDRAKYLRGRVLSAAGNAEAARALWDETAESGDRRARAGSIFERTLLMLESGEITRETAIDTLERLRFAWRGDDFELRLLQALAELHVAEKQFIPGLDAMKRSVTYFSDHPAAAAVTARMSELFADIFLEGELDRLPAREVLTLFYEFRELTPVGKEGDKVIQALADRLVAVDLLDHAADLLEHQLTYRIEGVEKARVGTRLAVILLMDRKPERALAALEASEMKGVTRNLADQRRRLEARALAEIGRTDDALALIRKDRSRDAGLLRADIFWRARDWAKAAAAIARLLEETPLETPLSPFASRHVLRLAVALSLADDRVGLAKLRERYAARMAGDANQGAFAMITSDVVRKDVPLRDLPAAVAEVATFEAFMTGYRERVRKGSLSAIN
ncbi:MAG: hypothetical protein ACE5LF_00945 [Alphaproteobacteria bacterium]